MSRYGGRATPIETGALPSTDPFTGDGSTVAFVLAAVPPSDQALFVYIDGVKQHTDSYSFSGTTLTFTDAPFNGAAIEVITVSQVGKTNVPADSSVTPSKTTGMQNVIQEQQTDYTAYGSGTTDLPVNDSIPEITEGDEFITVTITPQDASNILVIEGVLFCSASNNDTVSAALFKNAVTNALTSSLNYVHAASKYSILPVQHRMVAGTTSSITFRLRGGVPGANTFYVNGNSTSRVHGGVLTSYLKVTEYKA